MPIASLVVRIAADIADFEKNIAGVERTLLRTGRNLENIGSRLTQGLTLPLVAAVGTVAKAAIDFESSFAGVRKTVDATEEQFKALEGQFRELAKTMPLSVNEINKVAESAGQLGVKRENIVAFTESMIKLGTATNLTADEAATGMARFANALGEPNINMEKLGSALVALGNAGASTEKDILSMAGRMAGAGAQIGLSAGSIFGIANALSSVGIEADKGGTAFSRLFNDLNKAVSESSPKLELFAEVASRAGESLSKADFAKLFKEDSAGAISKFIEGLHAIKGAGGDLLGVISELGIKQTQYRDTVLLAANAAPQFAESIRLGNSAFAEGRALQDEYAERLKTTASQLIILKNNLQDIAITLGQAFLPVINDAATALKPFVQSLAGMATAFKELPEPVRNTVFALAGILASLGPVTFAIGKITSSWSALLGLVRVLIPDLAAAGSAFTRFAGPVALAGAAIFAVKETWDAFNRSTEEGFKVLGSAILPIGLLTKAIDALRDAFPGLGDALDDVATIVKNSLIIAFERLKDAFGIIKDSLIRTAETISNVFGPVFAALGVDMSRLADTMRSVVIPAVIATAAAFIQSIPGVRGLLELIAILPGFKDMAAALDRVAASTGKTVDELRGFKPVVAGLDGAFKDGKFSIDAWRGSLLKSDEGFRQTSEGMITFGSGVATNVVKPLKLAGEQSKETTAAIKAAAKALKEDLEEQLKSVGDAIGFVEQRIEDIGDAFEKDLVQVLKAVADDIAGVEQKIIDSGEDFERELTETMRFIVSEIEGVEDRINSIEIKPEFFGEEFGQQLGRIIGSAFTGGGIRNAVEDGASLVGSTLLSKLATKLTTGANAITGWLGGMISSALPIIGSLLGPLVGKIADAFNGIFGNRGRDLVKDFAASFGGFDALHKRLLDMGAAGETLWIKLTQGVGRNNPAQAAAVIAEVTAALDAFGTESERAARRLAGIGTAIEGVNAKAALFAAPFEALLKDTSIDGFTAKLAEMGQRGQAEFERLGTFAAAAFVGIVKETGDAIGALDKLSPSLTVLQRGLAEFGLTSTGTINSLLGMFSFINDAVTGPIFASIQATGKIFDGLMKGGLATKELFQIVATDIGASFRELEAKGGDVAMAMALSQPILQKLWEGQQTYGAITDETTARLLEQAEQQGIVGAHMKDVNQKILDVLIAIADVFGAKLPEAFRATAGAAQTAADDIERGFSNIKIPKIIVDVGWKVDEFLDQEKQFVPALASGGIVRRPTLALVGEAGPEAVVPLSQLGAVSSNTGTSTVIFEINGRQIAEATVPYLPGVIRRYVPA